MIDPPPPPPPPKGQSSDERIFSLVGAAIASLQQRTDTQWDRDAREAASAYIKSGQSDPDAIAAFSVRVADGIEQRRRARAGAAKDVS